MNLYDSNGDTALTLACKQGCNSVIKTMIYNGADVNHTDTNKFSPLYHAICKNNLEAVDLLIANGCNKKFQHNYGYVELAAKFCHKPLVYLLVNSGFHITIPEYMMNFLTMRKSLIRDFNTIIDFLKRWPILMQVLVFKDLKVVGDVDITTYYDIWDYMY
jgi:ankyrin repeat protein